MIKSFKCKHTQAIFEGKCPKQFKAFESVAERKLQLLDSALTIEDLKSPPGNRLEHLKGDRVGQWSIRINDQFRLCFQFEKGEASQVEIGDYH
jgi:proteic killer suppression protein